MRGGEQFRWPVLQRKALQIDPTPALKRSGAPLESVGTKFRRWKYFHNESKVSGTLS